MSDSIPADIRAAAVAVVDRGYDTGLIDAVAAALMAERERCAKIADRWSWDDRVAAAIAAHIRTPSTGEEQ